MRAIATYRRSILTITCIILCVAVFTKCINNSGSKPDKKSEEPKPRTGSNYVGSANCAGCHKDIYASHLATAHHLTSQPAEEKLIKGSFVPGKNVFAYSEFVAVAMEKRDSGFFQAEYVNGERKKSRRFDIVVGSGTKGQTYLSWVGSKLVQLPITYFTAAHQWSNSPGYPDRAVFNRPITSRCLECHSTYFQKTSDEKTEPEDFSRSGIIYGVDCEKCHGPASQHVEFEQQHPEDTTGRYIINPRTLSRQQNLDLCAVCHGGRLSKTQPSFSFSPGDKLSDFFSFDTVGRNAADIDVHGNQYGLLAASKCFVSSQMDCSSCHNTHKNERDNLAIFSQRCMNCHSEGHSPECKLTSQVGPMIKQNCIDCHMPRQPSRAIAVMLQGEETPTSALMRTHLIKPYPEETKKVIELIHKESGTSTSARKKFL